MPVLGALYSMGVGTYGYSQKIAPDGVSAAYKGGTATAIVVLSDRMTRFDQRGDL